MKTKIVLAFSLIVFLCVPCRAEINMSGAASMGMGNSGLAIMDDLNTVFLNPAGLNEVKNWGFTTLYTRRLDEINYLVAGAVLPLRSGAIGLSLTGSLVNDVPFTTMINGDLDQHNISFNTVSNYVLGVSYGFPLGPEGLAIGVKGKYFTQNLIEGSASGYDLDLGFRYRPLSWLTFALVEENVLPSSLGATLNWSTGLKEPLEAKTRLAAGIQHEASGLGVEGGIERRTMKNDPLLYRVGLEWWPSRILAMRAGIDQELVPVSGGNLPEICNDYSLGIGCRFGGFQFDYAYKIYAGYSSNNAHFFSISFLGKNDFLPPALEARFLEKRICRGERIKLGLRSSEKLSYLTAYLPGGEEIPLSLNEKNMVLLDWLVPEEMPLGKQDIVIKAVDLDGNKTSREVQFEISARQPSVKLAGIARKMATTEAELVVRGEVIGEELRLNGEIVDFINGKFAKIVDLKPGINRLKISIKGEDGLVKDEEYVVLRKNNKGANNVKK